MVDRHPEGLVDVPGLAPSDEAVLQRGLRHDLVVGTGAGPQVEDIVVSDADHRHNVALAWTEDDRLTGAER